MEQIYHSEQFKIFSGRNNRKVRHTGIANRIATINYKFFQEIFEYLLQCFDLTIKDKNKFNILKFDSTLVSASAKLLTWGMKIGYKDKQYLKFTIGMKNFLPVDAQIFKNQNEVSEEIALKKAILASKYTKDSVIVFDRGLQRRKTFCEFTKKNILFVTRLKSRLNYKEIRIFSSVKGKRTKTLKLKKDLIVCLKDEHSRLIKKEFRLIIAESFSAEEEILFLTNIDNIDAKEITDIYRRRWEIEIFFKFLKQHLNFKHLVSRTENGVKVMLYATFILAILLLVYKENNKISSYKIAKFRFANELEMEIIKEIVSFCRGDPSLFFSPKSLYPK